MKKILLLLCVVILGKSYAQQYRPQRSAQIYTQLQQLNKLGTVMYIAAHPDDENTRLISYLVHHDFVRTIYLSLTRGDGGQNILGNEQGAALGLIRTYEMMQARKLDGAEQLFTRFVDFGFTKSPEETFRFWDKKQVVEDIKTAIQQYKPDVLICRFPTTGEGGHGQHTASAIASLEAFKELQADKNPNVWKPKRILFNAFKFGTSNTLKPDQFKIITNQFDALLGESYGELAGRSRSEHKSQGAGTPQTYGLNAEHFELMAGAPMYNSLYDNIDTTWNRIGESTIGTALAKIINQFQFAQPEKSISDLLLLRKKIERIKDTFWRVNKLLQLDQIILSCAGVQAEVLTKKATTTPQEKLEAAFNIIARAGNVSLQSITANQLMLNKNFGLQLLPRDTIFSESITLHLQNQKLSEPYWMRKPPVHNQYQYADGYTNEPLSKNEFSVNVKVQIGDALISFPVPVSNKILNPTKGDVIEPVRVLPDYTITPVDNVIVSEKGKSIIVNLNITKNITLSNPQLVISSKGNILLTKNIDTMPKGSTKQLSVSIPAGLLNFENDATTLEYEIKDGENVFDKSLTNIQYDHIPTIQYFQKAQSTVLQKTWQSRVKRIAYISGSGDRIPQSLAQYGFDVTQLTLSDLTLKNLSQYEAIICGVRMVNTREDMPPYMTTLFEYIKNGGNLLMQYNTNAGLQFEDFAPYPITLSRSRVTEEDSKVSIINDALLKTPNKIIDSDFDNWVQERGLYFPEKWDERYQTVIAMSDSGEAALPSGILYAKYGKGNFVYTSLSFFRQLPAGNVGAIKLFINLINAEK